MPNEASPRADSRSGRGVSQGSRMGGGSCGHLACGLNKEPLQGGTEQRAPQACAHAPWEPVAWGDPALPRRRGQRCCTRPGKLCAAFRVLAPAPTHGPKAEAASGVLTETEVREHQDGRGFGVQPSRDSQRAIYRGHLGPHETGLIAQEAPDRPLYLGPSWIL